jgi:hypothetical protein
MMRRRRAHAGLQQVAGAVDVHVVLEGAVAVLAGRHDGGQMDDDVRGVAGDDGVHFRGADIGHLVGHTGRAGGGLAHVQRDDGEVGRLGQGGDGLAAEVAGAAGDEDFFRGHVETSL